MTDSVLIILLIALVLDWFVGDPDTIWSRIPHPVVVFGGGVGVLDARFNHMVDGPEARYRKGAVTITLLIGVSIASALVFRHVFEWLGVAGWFLECLLVFFLLAQKSLFDHVGAVVTGLREAGLDGGRDAVGLIVGRDPQLLDETGVCRAGIETLAENFSDGVVAPAFWYAVFGLPGLFAYKMINTADSMIGHRSEKYGDFGRAAAKIDDLANWLPARVSCVLIAIGALMGGGFAAARRSLSVALRDAGLHRSPNAGWPEAAIAGAANVALGGPRAYRDETVSQAFLNGTGRRTLRASDIAICLGIFKYACFALWGLIVFVLLVA